MLKDQDRIFKNLYNDLGWDIDSALNRDDWSQTKNILNKLALSALFLSLTISISSSEAKKAIEERLAPVGQVCVEGEGCATTGSEVTAAPVEKKSLPKVKLSEGSEHTVNMLNMGPGGTMAVSYTHLTLPTNREV